MGLRLLGGLFTCGVLVACGSTVIVQNVDGGGAGGTAGVGGGAGTSGSAGSGAGGATAGNGGSTSGSGGSTSGNGGSTSGSGGSTSGNGGSTSGNGGNTSGSGGEAGQGIAGSGGLAGSPNPSLTPMGPPTYWSGVDAGSLCRTFGFAASVTPTVEAAGDCIANSYANRVSGCGSSGDLAYCNLWVPPVSGSPVSSFQVLYDAMSRTGSAYDDVNFQSFASITLLTNGHLLITWSNGDKVDCDTQFAMEAGQVCFTPVP